REMRQLILETRAGMEIPEESLGKEIDRLLSERDRRQTLGQAGKALCLRQKGALERTLQKLETVGLLKK
ncbi:MAG: hypothetical protein KDK40_02575, partial [Chlamydiia bacterium]|nr:hypothetical protein [Chlamydiia bacterium]